LISHEIGTRKIVSVHAMKVDMGRRGIVPLLLDFDTRYRWMVKLTLLPLPFE